MYIVQDYLADQCQSRDWKCAIRDHKVHFLLGSCCVWPPEKFLKQQSRFLIFSVTQLVLHRGCLCASLPDCGFFEKRSVCKYLCIIHRISKEPCMCQALSVICRIRGSLIIPSMCFLGTSRELSFSSRSLTLTFFLKFASFCLNWISTSPPPPTKSQKKGALVAMMKYSKILWCVLTDFLITLWDGSYYYSWMNDRKTGSEKLRTCLGSQSL